MNKPKLKRLEVPQIIPEARLGLETIGSVEPNLDFTLKKEIKVQKTYPPQMVGRNRRRHNRLVSVRTILPKMSVK